LVGGALFDRAHTMMGENGQAMCVKPAIVVIARSGSDEAIQLAAQAAPGLLR
jgi:hypothetical protein